MVINGHHIHQVVVTEAVTVHANFMLASQSSEAFPRNRCRACQRFLDSPLAADLYELGLVLSGL